MRQHNTTTMNWRTCMGEREISAQVGLSFMDFSVELSRDAHQPRGIAADHLTNIAFAIFQIQAHPDDIAQALDGSGVTFLAQVGADDGVVDTTGLDERIQS